MFCNLKAEFVRKNLSPISAISDVLNCSERTARNKLNGTTEITVNEAKKIKAEYFPILSLDYLFAADVNEHNNVEKR